MINRKQFLKISGGTAASFFVAKGLPVLGNENLPFSPMNNDDSSLANLLELKAYPPEGTKAVRFFMDDMQVSEVPDLYAVKTNTKPVWKTFTDASWLPDGEHRLRIEADTKEGTKTIENKTINTTNRKTINRLSLTGAWQFAEAGELPEAALQGDRPPASQPGFSGGVFTKVMVPNSLGAIDKKWNQYEGILGIYKRNFSIGSLTKNEQYSLVLESCYWSGQVFINGSKVGETKGGYLPSRFDCTKFLKSGKNEIAVIVDNRFSTMGVFKRINEFY
ncbi:MAG: hypothetical protein M3Y85_10095 [Bacteroidota bacterium]|nr:hypothetical protein [Bacteroidota bacterium]